MSRKKETITLSIPPGTKEQLEAIARRLNILWGKEPSVSGLIVAIAQAQVNVGQPFTFTKVQVQSLQQATKLLVDSGNIQEAQTLIGLLLERGNLETPLRQSLLQQVSQPSQAWRILIEEHINNQQPFSLLYCNAQNQELEYTVHYAEICFEEKHFYLQIWCEEIDDIDNTDFPELSHIRCLRLDRIKAIVPINGYWRREGLEFIEVYLHLQGGLIKAYEPKEKDITDEIVGEVRQVVRRVVNPFWLVREVLRYGEDCLIVSPESMRDRLKQEVRLLGAKYDMDIKD